MRRVLLGLLPIIVTLAADAQLAEMLDGRLTDTQQKKLRRSSDFVAVNYYTTVKCRFENRTDIGWFADSDTRTTQVPDWAPGSPGVRVNPEGIGNILQALQRRYNNPEMIVTANGYSSKSQDESLQDSCRLSYIVTHINEMLKAVKLDGVNVRGYFAWNLMDGFEWNSGYTRQFGLHKVNFTSGSFVRTPKESARAYTEIIENNGFTLRL